MLGCKGFSHYNFSPLLSGHLYLAAMVTLHCVYFPFPVLKGHGSTQIELRKIFQVKLNLCLLPKINLRVFLRSFCTFVGEEMTPFFFFHDTCFCGTCLQGSTYINPLTLKSDWHLISPDHITLNQTLRSGE